GNLLVRIWRGAGAGNLPAYSTTVFLLRYLRECPAGAPTAWTPPRLWVPLPAPAGPRARVVGQHEPWRIRRVPRGLFCPARIIFLDNCTYVQYSCCYVLSPPYPRCCPEGARIAPAVATYEPRDPSRTVLYTVIAHHLETFLASLDADPDATGLPAYVERAFYDYLTLQRHLTHGLSYMLLRDVVIAHFSRPPWSPI